MSNCFSVCVLRNVRIQFFQCSGYPAERRRHARETSPSVSNDVQSLRAPKKALKKELKETTTALREQKAENEQNKRFTAAHKEMEGKINATSNLWSVLPGDVII